MFVGGGRVLAAGGANMVCTNWGGWLSIQGAEYFSFPFRFPLPRKKRGCDAVRHWPRKRAIGYLTLVCLESANSGRIARLIATAAFNLLEHVGPHVSASVGRDAPTRIFVTGVGWGGLMAIPDGCFPLADQNDPTPDGCIILFRYPENTSDMQGHKCAAFLCHHCVGLLRENC